MAASANLGPIMLKSKPSVVFKFKDSNEFGLVWTELAVKTPFFDECMSWIRRINVKIPKKIKRLIAELITSEKSFGT
jgi:hypothetical protein